jgi:hypothetical protein
MLQRLSILGFGNLEIGFSVAAALGNFFGEREVEIYAWDEAKEQCDVMCRVLRVFLKVNNIRHYVYSLETPDQALHASNAVILCSPYSGECCLPSFDVQCSNWPNLREWGPDEAKFQALRYINREDYPSVEIYAERENPLLTWLNQL